MASADDSSSTRVILTLDVGSSSVRCTAYRWDAPHQKIESMYGCCSSRTYSAIQPNSTGHIHLKHHRLLDGIDLCIDDELKRLGAFSEDYHVVGLGFSSFCMNLVGIDDEGETVGPTASLSYACNSKEVADECLLLKEQMGTDRLREMHQRTGAPLHTAYALPQLRAFYRHHLSQARHVYKWQTIASLCLSRWTGRDSCPISYSEASWTGLLDFRTCRWDEEALNLLPEACRDALPSLDDCTSARVLDGGIPEFPECLTDEGDNSIASVKVNPYWNRWPKLRGSDDGGGADYCRLFLGLGDGACANIGSKCSTPSRIAVTIGTSAAARVVIPLDAQDDDRREVETNDIHVPSGLFCYRVDRSHVILGGALTDGGSVVEWCRSLLGLESDEAFDECMLQVKAMLDAEYLETEVSSKAPVTMIPFLSGERSTGYRIGASGGLFGLTRETTPAHVVRASLEGVVLRLYAICKLLHHTIKEMGHYPGTVPPRIVASGKALECNEIWRQMLADCNGMEVELDSNVHEASSRGVARMVAIALTMNDDTSKNGSFKSGSQELLQEEVFSTDSSICEPHALATVVYWRHAAKVQHDLIHSVSPMWHHGKK